ncbi:MAG: sel1 repeat family protein [Verrucomicrobiales bacterium]|nr:sel1 repeat family protein [Verrucomicrobiales bacterium]
MNAVVKTLRCVWVLLLVTAAADSTAAGPASADYEKEVTEWMGKDFQSLKQGAEQKLPPAMLVLSFAYREGYGVGANAKLGKQWLDKAVEANYAPALCEMGIVSMLALTNGTPEVGSREAHHWLKRAADEGFIPAYRWLASLYAIPGTAWASQEKAVLWMSKGAEANDAPSQYLLGLAYEADAKRKSNIMGATIYPWREWIEKSAAQGFPAAQIKLGDLHLEKTGDDPANLERALAWFRRAADQGSSEGMIQIAMALYHHQKDATEGFDEIKMWLNKAASSGSGNARHLLKQLAKGQPLDAKEYDSIPDPGLMLYAANQGRADCMSTVGEMYRTGQGLRRDPREAAAWFRRAAQAKDPHGMMRYAECLERGYGVPVSFSEAARWYQRAADKQMGSTAAAYLRLVHTGATPPVDTATFHYWIEGKLTNSPADRTTWMAEIYWKGALVEQDKRKALELFREAALGGHPQAQNRVGEFHLAGVGGTPDVSQALLWFRAAATNHFPEAQLNLAKLYAAGQGVPKNLDKAWMLASAAARHPLPQAETLVRSTAAQLSPERLAKLHVHLKKYEEAHPITEPDWNPIFFTAPLAR